MDNKAILLKIFTERELYDMQLQYYSEVCRQPRSYRTDKNIILEKLGGMPVEKEKPHDE
jgi:hypothetical protein